MSQSTGTNQPWAGGVAAPFFPPALPEFDSAAIVVVQQADAESGVAVSYRGGGFSRQEWTTGHPVPLLIEDLKRPQVEQVRDEIRQQLATRGDGLDDLPLRAFLTVADLYLSPEPSGRYVSAVFGAITEADGKVTLGGTVSWPDGVTGTVVGLDPQVLGEPVGVSGQSHLPAFPAGAPVELRLGDLRSLIASLEKAQAAGGLDPLWLRMMDLAQSAAE
jgi:hypothetical protein